MINDNDDNRNNSSQHVPVTQNKGQKRNQQRVACIGEQKREEDGDDEKEGEGEGEGKGKGAEEDSEEKAVADYEQFFPARLHGLLDMLEKDGLSQICCFLPHGKAFMVWHQKHFVAELLPQWFRQTRWSSFQRQLNLYDFKRITVGPDKGAYYHRYFLRGQRELCRLIKRVRIKGTGPRKPSCPDEEPDFYHRESLLPLPSLSPSPSRAANQEAAALATTSNDSHPPPTVPAASPMPLLLSPQPATMSTTATRMTTTTTSQHNGILASPLSPDDRALRCYHAAQEAGRERMFFQNSLAENANLLGATDPALVQQLLIRQYLQQQQQEQERYVSDLCRIFPGLNIAALGTASTATTATPSIAASRITYPSSSSGIYPSSSSGMENASSQNPNSNFDVVAWLRENGLL